MAFKYRNWHTVSVLRVAATVVTVVLIPLAAQLPALGALGLLTVVMVGLIAIESLTFSELREQVRHEDENGEPAVRHGASQPG